MTGGNQPANIRVINRRFNDPASNNELGVLKPLLMNFRDHQCLIKC
jgi:hypothetical protein